MNVNYGTIGGYVPPPVPSAGTFSIQINFPVTPGTPYELQTSPDGGTTWNRVDDISTTPPVSTWQYNMPIPGGEPARLVLK